MTEVRKQSSRRWLWIGAAVVLVVVFLMARSALRERLTVRAAEVRHEQIVNTVSTNGRVEPEQTYQFYSPLATTVNAVHVQTGDRVARGKLLIVLDDVEARARVAAAESGVKAAQAQLDAVTHNGTQAERQASVAEIAQDRLTLDQAQHNLDALARLQSTGAAAPDEVASARQRLDSAQASLNAAQESSQSRYAPAELARAQATLADANAALAAAQQVDAETRYGAPIKGTVYTLDAAHSEFVAQGTLLLQMADLTHERVRAYFDEPDLGRLALGQSVVIRWDAKPGEEWHGHIERLPASVVTYTTRNVGEVLVSIDDPRDGLLPDTNVTVQVTTSSQPNALTIPREALHSENGRYYVYKIVDTELKRTKVTIGAPNLTQVPILSGLQDGDWVATGTTTGEPLQEGMPIKIQR
jgi:HlyD family secretion protein